MVGHLRWRGSQAIWLVARQSAVTWRERERERGGGGGPYVCMCNLQVISTLHMGIRSFNY